MAPEEQLGESQALAQLTGVRSSKPSYYREYRHTSASLDRSIRALASTSRALTAIASGAARLVEDFLHQRLVQLNARPRIMVRQMNLTQLLRPHSKEICACDIFSPNASNLMLKFLE